MSIKTDVLDIITSRKSCRAFLDRPVDREIVKKILEISRWAPSGVNHQPTQVAVLEKNTKKILSDRFIEAFLSGVSLNRDYETCPRDWHSPYVERRGEARMAMAKVLEGQEEMAEMTQEDILKWKRIINYSSFNAPIEIIVYIEKNMPKGSWVDVGMFLQNFFLAAQSLGLATCPQASFADYPDIVRETLKLDQVDIICGIALGYEDESHPINSLRTSRLPVDDFTTWHD